MRLLFVHEVNYREKVVFEMHDFPELLSLADHDVTFIDFGEGGTRSGLRRWFDWRTETAVVRDRAHSGAEVRVITPGRLLPPPLDRLLASLTQVPVLIRTLKSEPFDCVVLYAVPTNGWQALIVAQRLGVPVLFRALDISHRLRPTVFASLIERAERFIYRRADAVSANNHALARYIVENGGNPDTISVDYPVLDLERFSPGPKPPELLARYGLDDSAEVVQFMGTLYRFAGLDWLLRSIVPMLERRPSARVMFVGGGEAEAELRRVVKELGVGDQVIFTGWIDYDELAGHLRLADIAVTPFAEELVANSRVAEQGHSIRRLRHPDRVHPARRDASHDPRGSGRHLRCSWGGVPPPHRRLAREPDAAARSRPLCPHNDRRALHVGGCVGTDRGCDRGQRSVMISAAPRPQRTLSQSLRQ